MVPTIKPRPKNLDPFEVDDEQLIRSSREQQLELVEQWFRARFEDPAHRTPFESREGGYIYIWGGPYDARWELSARFEDIAPEDVLGEVVELLEQECYEWAPTEREGDYDESLFEAVTSNVRALSTLETAFSHLQSLLGVQVPEGEAVHYLRLLHANAISAMETFLADTVTNRILSDEDLLQRYLDWDKRFAERKVSYKDVIREAPKVKDAARDELLDLVWHNLAKVKELYGKVLSIDIGPIDELSRAVAIRHDIVHRNGRTKEGEEVAVTKETIAKLVLEIGNMGRRIDVELETRKNMDAGPF